MNPVMMNTDDFLKATSVQHTPGPWKPVKSFVGWVVTRTWSSGFYQRMQGSFNTEAEALAAIAKAAGGAA